MEKIDTDYKQRNWKFQASAKLFNPFNSDNALVTFVQAENRLINRLILKYFNSFIQNEGRIIIYDF